MAEQPMIVVRGEATREVPPELAIFSVTVSARDKDRQTALTRLTERAAELRSHLDDFPDAIERRETSGVQVHPELKRGGERISAYTGSVTTTVTVTDFTVLGELLLRLADRDQTSLSGPWWQLRPGSRAGAEVRRAAIADALGRAREYAEAVGAQVDRLVEIADENAGGGGQPMMRMAAFGGAPEADLALEVDPQVQTVLASVLVRVTITEPTALK
ncbi:SIMPL domain-containing protein [Actinoplanes sp. NPDC048967]|uniref:SIMPL domain-containing protein n=1 Tax=Actinoplanes sp. NPDC048967 TaxID=3155269 RepID=UPI0033F6322B